MMMLVVVIMIIIIPFRYLNGNEESHMSAGNLYRPETRNEPQNERWYEENALQGQKTKTKQI